MTTVLGGDDSPTDRLVVNGSTVGDTSITVTNAGGAGGLTVEGIELVTVKGKSDGVFTLANRVAAGAYDYSLVTKNGNWYLVSAADGTVPQTDPTPAEPEKTPGTPREPHPGKTSLFRLRLRRTRPVKNPEMSRHWIQTRHPRRIPPQKVTRHRLMKRHHPPLRSRVTPSVLKWPITPRTSTPRTPFSFTG